MIEFAQTGVRGGHGRRQRLGFKTELGNDEPCAGQDALLARADSATIKICTRPGACFKCLATERIDNGGEDRSVVLDQGDGDHPIVAALDKGPVPSMGSTTQTRRAFSRSICSALSSDSQP